MERKLTTILAADLAGYSRLVGEAEEQTLSLLRVCREIVNGLIAGHGGRIFGSAGDSVMAEFASPVEAVRCALEIHETIHAQEADTPALAQMQYRIGIHLGDVVVEGDTLNGDAVNIAARLESLAEPGGVLVSGEVQRHVHKAVNAVFMDLGTQELKNITEPVKVYRVAPRPLGSFGRMRSRLSARRVAVVALGALVLIASPFVVSGKFPTMLSDLFDLAHVPQRQSIAVLPMQNLSGDPNDDYFSDGMTNDLTTDLAKFKNLFVISSYSSFQYKNKPTQAEEISRKLGVRYLLEGSVQRLEDRLRINAQLIDGTTGHHVWAERYERETDDLFDVQNDIVQRIVATLSVKVTALEEKHAMAKETTNMEAYDYYLKAIAFAEEYTKEGNIEADTLLQKAYSLDKKFARALTWRSYVLLTRFQELWGDNPDADLETAYALARQAIEIDRDDYYNQWTYAVVSHAAAGSQLAAGSSKAAQLIAQGNEAFDKALKSNSNDADLLVMHADVLKFQGQKKAEDAIVQINRAMQINPEYPEWYLWSLGAAEFHAKQYSAAVDTMNRMKEPQPRVHLILAASYARLSEKAGSPAEVDRLLKLAKGQLATFLERTPDWTLAHELKQLFGVSVDQEHWIGALKLAGAK